MTDLRDPALTPGDAPLPTPADERSGDDLCGEEIVDAVVEGDRPYKRGTAAAAFRYPAFRRVWSGWLSSNVGSWMQNVVLGAFALKLTNSTTFVSIVLFAQLGPLLLFSLVGGTLADRFDRKRLIIGACIEQATAAFALAWVVSNPDPSRVGIVLCVFAIGMGQALIGPTFSSVLPTLVEKEDLPGAVSLTSMNMNGSRVIGSVLGGVVWVTLGVSWVFAINAVTYFLIIAAILRVAIPNATHDPNAKSGLARMLEGFTVARHNRVVGRVLVTCTVFSFFCLIWIGQLAAVAERNLGIDAKSTAYSWLYAFMGLGALAGAAAVGTVYAGRDLDRLVKLHLAGFTVLLALLASERIATPAFPTIFVLGFFYFVVITGLSTLLQQQLDDATRGRVMSLWIMAFGGTVPIGNLVLGPLMDVTNVTTVLLIGVGVAAFLTWWADFRDPVTAEPDDTAPAAATAA